MLGLSRGPQLAEHLQIGHPRLGCGWNLGDGGKPAPGCCRVRSARLIPECPSAGPKQPGLRGGGPRKVSRCCRHRPREPDPGEFSPPVPTPAQLHLAPALRAHGTGRAVPSVLSPRCCPLAPRGRGHGAAAPTFPGTGSGAASAPFPRGRSKHLPEKRPDFSSGLYSSSGWKAAIWEFSKSKLFQKCLSGRGKKKNNHHHQNKAFQQFPAWFYPKYPATPPLSASGLGGGLLSVMG